MPHVPLVQFYYSASVPMVPDLGFVSFRQLVAEELANRKKVLHPPQHSRHLCRNPPSPAACCRDTLGIETLCQGSQRLCAGLVEFPDCWSELGRLLRRAFSAGAH